MFASSIVIGFAVIGLFPADGLEQPREASATDILRDAVNKIFSILKLRTNRNAKLKEYLTIHKYFVSVTTLEHQKRNEVTKLIQLDTKTDNGTTNFTTAINEALNEQNINEDVNATNDNEVNKYVDNFLTTLTQLKEMFLVNNSYENINSDILQHFNIPNGNQNNSVYNKVDSNENATDENEFWVPMENRRIYRGETTKIKYFPFVASVQIFNQFTCAGSIIKSDLVITAASCLQLAHNNRFYRENPSFLSVRVGSTFYNGGGENIPIMEVYFYPTYTPKTLRDNLAIMRLLRALKFKKKQVKKVATDEFASTLPLNTDGITIVGWGAKTISNKVHDPWKNRISMDVLDIYPLSDCQDIYSKKYVTKKHFCAGFLSKGGGACNRDVGAPGLVSGVLTGVVSFGSPSCGAADAPTVFTKLGYYANWIEEIKSEEVQRLYFARTTTRLPYTQTILSTISSDDRNFKIEPMSKKNIKAYHELESLRTDQKEVFKEFLETVFDSKEVEKYENKLSGFLQKKNIEEKGEEESVEKNDKPSKDLTRTGNNTEEISEEQVGQEKAVTNMGNFDADDVEPEESDSVPVSASAEKPQDGYAVEMYHDTKKTVVTKPKESKIKQKKIEEESEEGLSIEDIVRQGDSTEADTINIDDDINKQVDQLIRNLDVEKAISPGLVENLDKKKVIDKTKLTGDVGNERKDDMDDTILTLLYLSDAERKAADLKINNDQKSEKYEGMGIEVGVTDDTLRTSNVTNESHEYMSKGEMYDILVDAIKS